MSAAQHGSRYIFRAVNLFNATARPLRGGADLPASTVSSWTCRQCQLRPTSRICRDPGRTWSPLTSFPQLRGFSSTSERPSDVTHSGDTNGKLHTADPKELPSDSQSRRTEISKRLHTFMDTMLAKATVAGQRVNVYTGTDYSGIETLRQQIGEQERSLKSRLESVTSSRDVYAAAHASQAAAQKEVVSLLERKSSWSPTDLDRYTSLIRSEHLHEQSVVAARQALAAAEKDLEQARTELERKERKMYHEEQIWSDTIRRNSTWVTFALMGLNILLLLANIGIFEPWRRRKLVREVKQALDSKTVTAHPMVLDSANEVGARVVTTVGTEREIDTVVEPAVNPVAFAVEDALPIKLEDAAVILEQPSGTSNATASGRHESVKSAASRFQHAWMRTREVAQDWAKGPLSGDRIVLSKVELTSLAVESAILGVAIMSCVASLLDSR